MIRSFALFWYSVNALNSRKNTLRDALTPPKMSARQRGQLNAAIHAEVERGEARRFYVKQVESDEELRAYIYDKKKILATLSGKHDTNR